MTNWVTDIPADAVTMEHCDGNKSISTVSWSNQTFTVEFKFKTQVTYLFYVIQLKGARGQAVRLCTSSYVGSIFFEEIVASASPRLTIDVL